MSKTHRPALTLAVLSAVAVLSACGSSDSTSTTTSGTATEAQAGSRPEPEVTQDLAALREWPDELPDLAPLSKAPPEGRSIYYVNSGSGAAKEMGSAIERATDALGWDYQSLTYELTNPASGNSAYLTAVNAGADGIISTGLPYAATDEGRATADAEGVEVVLINSEQPPETEGVRQVGNALVTGEEWAHAVAVGVVGDAAERGEQANVGVITSSGIPVMEKISEVMVSEVEEICPECSAEAIDVAAADHNSGQSSKTVVSFIQRNPDVNYVNMIFGAVEGDLRPALDAAGLSDVRIVGAQPTPAQNLEAKDGGSTFWVQMPWSYQGWAAVDAVARAAVGDDADVHNSRPMPVWIVDEENMTFDPNVLPEFPKGFEDHFERLWKVG